ncbi:MAG TPA: AtpZ/AtpI family protein [Pantanalinema sp.]
MKGIEAAYGFAGALLGGTALGYFVDRWFGVAPWGLLAGAVLGFATGLYALYVALMRQDGK